MNTDDFRLRRDPFGRLVLELGDDVYETVAPVRSFPISAPDDGIALVGAGGTELLWIDRLQDLPEDARRLVWKKNWPAGNSYRKYAPSATSPALPPPADGKWKPTGVTPCCC